MYKIFQSYNNTTNITLKNYNGNFANQLQHDFMNWINLTSEIKLEELLMKSFDEPILIFKHSTRCGISAMALRKLESEWQADTRAVPYLLDLIQNRDISNCIAQQTGIAHQSPQAILLKNGKVVYSDSHSSINYNCIKIH
jgi:bacillithiol system protein YtxJ